MEKQKISVIVPCHNAAGTIIKCVGTILSGTYKNVEVICVDDGSTDDTAYMLDEYAKKDKRVRVFHQENRGAAAARNLGLSEASGELVAFADADDWIESKTYSLAAAKMTPDVDLVKWGARVEYPEGDFKFSQYIDNYFLPKFPEGKIDIDNNFIINSTADAWSKLFRMSIIKKHGIRFPESGIHEDYGFCWTYMSMARKAYYIQSRLYHYVQSEDSIMEQVRLGRSDKNYDKLAVLDYMHGWFSEKGVYEERADLLAFEINAFFFDPSRMIYLDRRILRELRARLDKYGITNDENIFFNMLRRGKYSKILKSLAPVLGNIRKMMAEPLVSILVAAYNSEQYIDRCLSSLVNQTHRNIQIVCVDDGSSDNTQDILARWAMSDPRILAGTTGKNLGIAGARNAALKLARGKYVMWCDSDDMYAPTAAEKMAAAMEGQGVDLVCALADVYQESADFSIRNKYEAVWEYNTRFLGRQELSIEAICGVSKVLWAKMFKRSIIDKWQIGFTDLPVGEDVAFVYKYLAVADSAYSMADRLYCYFLRPDSVLGKLFEKEKGVFLPNLHSIGDLIDFVKERKLERAYPLCNEMYFHEVIFALRNLESVPQAALKELDDNLKLIVSNSAYTSCVMDIFFAADDKYAEQLGVAITSILLNAGPGEGFRFHILDGGISKKNKRLLERTKEIKACEIEYLEIDERLFNHLPITEFCEYISTATYFRYIIPKLKPMLDRCLYLDCDIVALGSLRRLWETELGQNYVAAVEDGADEVHVAYKKYGVKRPFNAGVLLINIRKWLDDNIVDDLFDNTEKLRVKMTWQDQDVFNYTFKGKVKFVNAAYNLQFGFFWNPMTLMQTDPQELYAAKYAPVVVHYSGVGKPWLPKCGNPYWYAYFQILKQSPFKVNYEKRLKAVLP